METSILSNLIKRLKEKHDKYSTISIAKNNTFDSYIEDDPTYQFAHVAGLSEKEIIERFESIIKMDEFPLLSKSQLLADREHLEIRIEEINSGLEKFNQGKQHER